MVGSSPVPTFHFLDRDLASERPVKRLRITGKRTAGKRSNKTLGEPPTPERWKRLILHGSGHPRDEVGSPRPFSSRRGWLMTLSDARDLSLQEEVCDVLSPEVALAASAAL